MKIEAQGITVHLGGAAVVRDADLTVAPGEMVGLIGPNGAGKTALLRVIARLQTPDAGTVLYDGQAASAFPDMEMARRIAYLAQGETVCWPLTVERIVALGRLPHRSRWRGPSAADRAAIEGAMEATALGAFRDRPLETLSGGERLRVLLARALAVEAEVLLVDEPTAALDPHHQLQILELLRREVRNGHAVVAVLHDLTAAARFCDRLVLLDKGRVVAAGTPAAVLTDAVLGATYRITAVRGLHENRMYIVPWQEIN